MNDCVVHGPRKCISIRAWKSSYIPFAASCLSLNFLYVFATLECSNHRRNVLWIRKECWKFAWCHTHSYTIFYGQNIFSISEFYCSPYRGSFGKWITCWWLRGHDYGGSLRFTNDSWGCHIFPQNVYFFMKIKWKLAKFKFFL